MSLAICIRVPVLGHRQFFFPNTTQTIFIIFFYLTRSLRHCDTLQSHTRLDNNLLSLSLTRASPEPETKQTV